MSSTAGDEGQGGRFGAKEEVRSRRLPLAVIFFSLFSQMLGKGFDVCRSKRVKVQGTVK